MTPGVRLQPPRQLRLRLKNFTPHMLQSLPQTSEGIDLRKDRQALQRLTEAAEKAKVGLLDVAYAWQAIGNWSLGGQVGSLGVSTHSLTCACAHTARRVCMRVLNPPYPTHHPFIQIELSGTTQASINLPFITATADGPKHIDTNLTKGESPSSGRLGASPPAHPTLRHAPLQRGQV